MQIPGVQRTSQLNLFTWLWKSTISHKYLVTCQVHLRKNVWNKCWCQKPLVLLYVRLGKYFLFCVKCLPEDCNKTIFISEKSLCISGVDDVARVGAHSVKATVLFPSFSLLLFFSTLNSFKWENFPDGLPSFYPCVYLNCFRIFTPFKKTCKIHPSVWLSISGTLGSQPRVSRSFRATGSWLK